MIRLEKTSLMLVATPNESFSWERAGRVEYYCANCNTVWSSDHVETWPCSEEGCPLALCSDCMPSGTCWSCGRKFCSQHLTVTADGLECADCARDREES